MLSLIVAFQIAATAATPSTAGAGAPRADSVAIVSRMREETTHFLWVWRFYWEASEALRHEIQGEIFPQYAAYRDTKVKPLTNRIVRDRVNAVHCHPDARGGFPVLRTIIREGGQSLRAICPRWSLPESPPHDERVSLDDAIAEPLRSGTRLARAELITNLEQASASVPGDAWVIGQRVRFAVDQGDPAATERAVRDCRAAAWWCAALGGYARYAAGDPEHADSLFMASFAAMTPAERCSWDDVSQLLDDPGRARYTAMSCQQRDSLAARLWWLADPLYSEAGNERRAEHYARLVMVRIRRDATPSDRWNWTEGDGGTSLREMLLRYGWPAHAWWSGPREDQSHYSYLGVGDDRVRELGVFTTAEYNGPRFHTVPAWSALVDPWHAPSSAWTIDAPRDDGGKPDMEWWPQEHYARRAGPLMPIPQHQTALLRRERTLELAVATNLSQTRLTRGMSRAVTVALAVTPSPDSLQVERKTGSLDSVIVSRTAIAPKPTIIGLEARAGDVIVLAARTRFGVTPPPPLSVMGSEEIAISEPVLVRPPQGDARPTSNPDDALAEMLGTTRLSGMSRVGIYWETYGIAAGDSVDLSVRIDRLGSAGLLRKLGTALRVADRVDGAATIRWKEPQPAAATTTIPGPVPIQGRNVSIDLSRLVPDRYAVTVSVARNGTVVSATREFEIEKP